MPNLGEALGNDWNIGVWAFGCSRADLLVWTAGTSIALTGLFGLGAWAVLWVMLADRFIQDSAYTYLVQVRQGWAPPWTTQPEIPRPAHPRRVPFCYGQCVI